MRQVPIKGFEEYKITDMGEIIGKFGRKLRPRISPDGYVRARFCKKDGQYSRAVYRIVLENFTGPCPEGKECNHINGIKTDNRVENLEWITRSQNSTHAFTMGLRTQEGEKNSRVKLTNHEVRTIRGLLKNTALTHLEIAEMFEVTRSVVSNIKARRLWNYVEAGI